MRTFTLIRKSANAVDWHPATGTITLLPFCNVLVTDLYGLIHRDQWFWYKVLTVTYFIFFFLTQNWMDTLKKLLFSKSVLDTFQRLSAASLFCLPPCLLVWKFDNRARMFLSHRGSSASLTALFRPLDSRKATYSGPFCEEKRRSLGLKTEGGGVWELIWDF